jgi:hypothetical protein
MSGTKHRNGLRTKTLRLQVYLSFASRRAQAEVNQQAAREHDAQIKRHLNPEKNIEFFLMLIFHG